MFYFYFRPYYETRANYNGLLKAQKKRIMELENRVRDAKMTYNEALKNLEKISEEIHKMRDERSLCNAADDQRQLVGSERVFNIVHNVNKSFSKIIVMMSIKRNNIDHICQGTTITLIPPTSI